MNPIHKLLHDSAYHTIGIVPIESLTHDYNKYLASLPPDEQRKMKRKFRKLWRKFAKHPGDKTSKLYVKQLGLGEKEPSKATMRARKAEVSRRIRADVIRPLIESTKKLETKEKTDSANSTNTE